MPPLLACLRIGSGWRGFGVTTTITALISLRWRPESAAKLRLRRRHRGMAAFESGRVSGFGCARQCSKLWHCGAAARRHGGTVSCGLGDSWPIAVAGSSAYAVGLGSKGPRSSQSK